MYAKFLIDILNLEEGKNLLQKVKYQLNNKHSNIFNDDELEKRNGKGTDLKIFESNEIPCVIVSANINSYNQFGLIKRANIAFQRVFGYSQQELKNHFVEKLMPQIY